MLRLQCRDEARRASNKESAKRSHRKRRAAQTEEERELAALEETNRLLADSCGRMERRVERLRSTYLERIRGGRCKCKTRSDQIGEGAKTSAKQTKDCN